MFDLESIRKMSCDPFVNVLMSNARFLTKGLKDFCDQDISVFCHIFLIFFIDLCMANDPKNDVG